MQGRPKRGHRTEEESPRTHGTHKHQCARGVSEHTPAHGGAAIFALGPCCCPSSEDIQGRWVVTSATGAHPTPGLGRGVGEGRVQTVLGFWVPRRGKPRERGEKAPTQREVAHLSAATMPRGGSRTWDLLDVWRRRGALRHVALLFTLCDLFCLLFLSLFFC